MRWEGIHYATEHFVIILFSSYLGGLSSRMQVRRRDSALRKVSRMLVLLAYRPPLPLDMYSAAARPRSIDLTDSRQCPDDPAFNTPPATCPSLRCIHGYLGLLAGGQTALPPGRSLNKKLTCLLAADAGNSMAWLAWAQCSPESCQWPFSGLI